MIRKQKRLHKNANKVNSEESCQKFRKTRNEYVNLIKNAKSANLEKQINSLNSTSLSVKQWWKTLRTLSGLPTKASNYPPLLINNAYIDDDVEKVNAFNLT